MIKLFHICGTYVEGGSDMLLNSMIFLWVFLPFVIIENALFTFLPISSPVKKIKCKMSYVIDVYRDTVPPQTDILVMEAVERYDGRLFPAIEKVIEILQAAE